MYDVIKAQYEEKKARRMKELEGEIAESMEMDTKIEKTISEEAKGQRIIKKAKRGQTIIEGRESEMTKSEETKSEEMGNGGNNKTDDVIILQDASLEKDHHIALHKIAIFTALKVSENF